jgi:hypothetical protein
MDGTALTINLVLHLDGEAISGYATGDGDEPRQFDGWIGLIAAIGRYVDGAHLPEADPALARIRQGGEDDPGCTRPYRPELETITRRKVR